MLVDLVLWTTVFAVGISFLVQWVEIQSGQKRVQAEARILSDLADAAARSALTGLHEEITSTISAGGARAITITDLNDHDTDPVIPRNRELHLVQYAPNPTTLWILAYTTGIDAGTPRPEPGIVNLGVIDNDSPCGSTTVCGPGLRWNHSAITSLLTTPPADGSMVAVRLLGADSAGDPFVWRINTGNPTLATMTTDLDMNGNDIENTGQVSVRNMTVNSAMQVNGDSEVAGLVGLTASNGIRVEGDLELEGMLTGSTMTSEEFELAGNDVAVTNDIAGNRLGASGKITLDGDLKVGSRLATGRVTGDLSSDGLAMVSLNATSTTVGGNVVVNRATTGDLDLDPGQLTIEGILYTTRCTGPGCTVSP